MRQSPPVSRSWKLRQGPASQGPLADSAGSVYTMACVLPHTYIRIYAGPGHGGTGPRPGPQDGDQGGGVHADLAGALVGEVQQPGWQHVMVAHHDGTSHGTS